MMASSRPVYSPMSTVIFEVPISTAPMKVVLELTFDFRLGGREKRKKWSRRRSVRRLHIAARDGLDRHRYFTSERQVDAGPRTCDARKAIDHFVEVCELNKEASLGREESLRAVLHRDLELAIR